MGSRKTSSSEPVALRSRFLFCVRGVSRALSGRAQRVATRKASPEARDDRREARPEIHDYSELLTNCGRADDSQIKGVIRSSNRALIR